MNTMDFHTRIPDLPIEENAPDIDGSDSALIFNSTTPEYPISNLLLESMLEDICIKGSYIIEPLSSHVCALQEAFLDTLYGKLEKAGVDLTEKITIHQNLEGELKVAGDHPEKEAIEKVLMDTPALAEVFTTLSSHSEIARDIVNINRIFAAIIDDKRYDSEENHGYHLSLKGGMSHFYFI